MKDGWIVKVNRFEHRIRLRKTVSIPPNPALNSANLAFISAEGPRCGIVFKTRKGEEKFLYGSEVRSASKEKRKAVYG